MVSGVFHKTLLGAVFLCCLLQIATAGIIPDPNTPVSPRNKPTGTNSKGGNTLVNGMLENIAKAGPLTQFFSAKFKEIPESLEGVSDSDLQTYVKTLTLERRAIQRHMIYHMTQCWAAAVGSYFFASPSVLGFIKMVGTEDEGQRKSLEEQWDKHQERMAKFVLEYIKVKKLNPTDLPRNAVGIQYVKVDMGHEMWEYLPVLIKEKGEQMPDFAKGISNSANRIMKSWWVAPN